MACENQKMTFEAALSRLEEIVRSMENGNAMLDESLTLFEEGVSLVKFCTKALDEAEQKVKILQKGDDGTVMETDFTGSARGIKMEIEKLLMRDAALVNDALPTYLETTDDAVGILYESMRYSALSGGKRIRPFLVFEFCRMFGGREKAGARLLGAIECVHASSLIHDDMPCMDNDAPASWQTSNISFSARISRFSPAMR